MDHPRLPIMCRAGHALFVCCHVSNDMFLSIDIEYQVSFHYYYGLINNKQIEFVNEIESVNGVPLLLRFLVVRVLNCISIHKQHFKYIFHAQVRACIAAAHVLYNFPCSALYKRRVVQVCYEKTTFESG